jgi:hypothetical protein
MMRERLAGDFDAALDALTRPFTTEGILRLDLMSDVARGRAVSWNLHMDFCPVR